MTTPPVSDAVSRWLAAQADAEAAFLADTRAAQSRMLTRVYEAEARMIADALLLIAWRAQAVAIRQAELELEEARSHVTTCAADGCLVRLDEVCPACRVRAASREKRRTRSVRPVPRSDAA
jgi:hypothetical protein